MVTYGGMAKQPVMVPVVSTGDAFSLGKGSAVPRTPPRMSHPRGAQICSASNREPPAFFLLSRWGLLRDELLCILVQVSWLYLWRVCAAVKSQQGNDPAGAKHQTPP